MQPLSRRARATLACCVFSVAVHVLLIVAVALMPAPKPVEPQEIVEVALVQGDSDGRPPGGGHVEGSPGAAPGMARGVHDARRPHRAGRRAAGQREHARASAPSAQTEGEAAAADEGAPGILSMRSSVDGSGGPTGPSSAAADANRDRFASFRPLANRPRDEVRISGRAQDDGLEMVRYDDGGRLLRGDGGGGGGGPPGAGQQGLLSLASSRLGGSTGERQCDPYRRWPATSERTLVLLVDTSGSIVAKERAPAALVCAAGAALSALRRGCAVSVVNFSSESWQIRPTRSKDAIYSVLSRAQGASTILPRVSSLSLGAGPIDYVLVSDAAIHNLKDVLPDYQRAVQRRPDNRALLLVLGEEDLKSVAALQGAGFEVDAVEHPGAALRRFAMRRPPKLAH
jgi:hypothetical protein